MSGSGLKFLLQQGSPSAVDYDYVDKLGKADGIASSNGVYGHAHGHAHGGGAYHAYDRSGGGGSAYDRSGYGHTGGGYGHKAECCELVVDPLLFLSMLGFILFSTYFLNTVITMDTMLPSRRRRRRSEEGILSYSAIEDRMLDVVHSGRPPPMKASLGE